MLTEFLPIIFFSFIVVFFKVSATGNAFVFFAQVITTAFSLTGGGTIQITDISKLRKTLERLPAWISSGTSAVLLEQVIFGH